MAKKEDIGYVYIFTNESFREGWIKIGKTKNIKKRLNDLDNTSCPLPFDVYATLKTNRYEDAETFVHEFISHFNRGLRVRPNREYFKVSPREALEILYQVKRLMNEEGAEITVYDEKCSKSAKQLEQKYGKQCLKTNDKTTSSSVENTDVNTWLIPYNKNNFKLAECFEKLGEVYWHISNNFKSVKKGDIGYIYGAKPEARIRFRFEVIAAHLSYSPAMDIEDEFATGSINADYKEMKFALLRMTGETTIEELKLQYLTDNGLKGAPLSAINLSQEKYKGLLNYIEENF